MPLCSDSRKACNNFSIINRFNTHRSAAVYRKDTSDVLELRFDALQTAQPSLSASTYSRILSVILARRSVTFAFFVVKVAIAKRKTYKKSDHVDSRRRTSDDNLPFPLPLPTFSSPESVVSCSRGLETRGDYKLSRVVLGTRMANDQNKPLSMTKLEKPYFRGLKTQ